MEGESWSSLVDDGIVPREHRNLIIRLQRIHDRSSVDTWKDHLTAAAEEFDLKTPTV